MVFSINYGTLYNQMIYTNNAISSLFPSLSPTKFVTTWPPCIETMIPIEAGTKVVAEAVSSGGGPIVRLFNPKLNSFALIHSNHNVVTLAPNSGNKMKNLIASINSELNSR